MLGASFILGWFVVFAKPISLRNLNELPKVWFFLKHFSIARQPILGCVFFFIEVIFLDFYARSLIAAYLFTTLHLRAWLFRSNVFCHTKFFFNKSFFLSTWKRQRHVLTAVWAFFISFSTDANAIFKTCCIKWAIQLLLGCVRFTFRPTEHYETI